MPILLISTYKTYGLPLDVRGGWQVPPAPAARPAPSEPHDCQDGVVWANSTPGPVLRNLGGRAEREILLRASCKPCQARGVTIWALQQTHWVIPLKTSLGSLEPVSKITTSKLSARSAHYVLGWTVLGAMG